MDGPTELSEARKKEILEMSREANRDEGMENAELKGFRLGEYTMVAVAVPILVIALFHSLSIFYAVGACLVAFVLGQSIMEYRFTKRTYHLIWVIGTAAGTVICFALFLGTLLGWWKDEFHFWGLLS